jgi:hypothetical protein
VLGEEELRDGSDLSGDGRIGRPAFSRTSSGTFSSMRTNRNRTRMAPAYTMTWRAAISGAESMT